MTNSAKPTRINLYFLQADDGTFVYISAGLKPFTYDSIKLFIGDGLTMNEIPVNLVERLRDGGTTYIYTDNGTFHFPSPTLQMDMQVMPSWSGDPALDELRKVNPEAFHVVETEEGVTITKKYE